jgi:hypothetical protein
MSKSQPISQNTTQTTSIPQWLGSASQGVAQAQGNLPQWSQYGGGNPYAGLTPDQLQALGVAQNNPGGGVAGSAIPFANALAGFHAPQISPGQIGADTQSLMNPFIQSVLNASNAQIDRNTAGAVSGQDAALAAQHAFGGDRQAIADATTRGLAEQQKATMTAQLMSQGYGSAQQAALAALQGNQNAALQGANIGLGGVGAMGNLAQILGGLNMQQLQGLLGAGGVQQQTATQQGMFPYQQYLNQFQIPENILQARAGALGSLPHSTTQTGQMTGTAYSNPLATALGFSSLLGSGGMGSLGTGMGSALGGIGTGIGNMIGGLGIGAGGLSGGLTSAGTFASMAPAAALL